MTELRKRSRVRAPAVIAQQWLEGPAGRQRLLVPWGGLRLAAQERSEGDSVQRGDLSVCGKTINWTLRSTIKDIETTVSMVDEVLDFQLPIEWLSRFVCGIRVARSMEAFLRYREEVRRHDLELLSSRLNRPRFRILTVGASGYLGKRLNAFLVGQGHLVRNLTRYPSNDSDIGWDPLRGYVDLEKLSGFDIAINLAGENLANGRWTKSFKQAIWRSRVDLTRFLVASLGKAKRPPIAYIASSGIGFYGGKSKDVLDESSPGGPGYLAELCQKWEEEACLADRFADRVVLLRTSAVLDAGGGALAKMRDVFKWGVGGPLGNGRQGFPWISLEDWIGAVDHLLNREASAGPYNLVAPDPIDNKGFTKSLGSVLGRPAIVPTPAAALKLALGEFAEEALLSGPFSRPARLLEEGFEFRYPSIDDALRFTLGRV